MTKIYTLCLTFLALFLVFYSANSQKSFAAGSCSPIYNGGITTRQYCPTPSVLPTPAPFKENLSNKTNPTPVQQTKGGQKIFPAQQSKTTPSTGPEDWSLPALFFIGALGFLLRNKAKA
jgi:hypothetical protein